MLARLICVAAIAGCTVQAGEPTGVIRARWDFGTVAGATLACPAGHGQVEVAISGNGGSTQRYDCAATTSGAIEVPIGVYAVTMAVDDGAGDVYARSRTFDVLIGDSLATDHAEVAETFIDDGGRIEVSARLRDFLGGESDCVTLGIAQARVVLSGPASITDTLPCDAVRSPNRGVTRPVPAAPYQAKVEFLDGDGNVKAATGQTSAVVFAPNGYVHLLELDIRP